MTTYHQKYVQIKYFGDAFSMLRNIWMAFHFLDKGMMRKNIITMIRPNWNMQKQYDPLTRKKRVEIDKIQRKQVDGARFGRPNI